MPLHPGQNANGPIGKIGSLPLTLRTAVNRQLDDNIKAEGITAWLNAQPEVRKVLDQKWRGRPITKDNVCLWRQKDYRKWVRRREQVENLRDLSEYALKLGEATGGSIADGSAAIAGGKIMAALEQTSGNDLHKMVRSITQLRSGDISRARLRQNEKKIAQADEKLELVRKRFQRETAELFLKWCEDKRAREIVESRDGNAEKIELLGRAMFGEDW